MEFAQMAQSLWEDAGIRECFDRRAEFRSDWVHDNIPYFMDNFNRIAGPDYVPNQQDMLNMRKKTFGTPHKVTTKPAAPSLNISIVPSQPSCQKDNVQA